MAIEMKTTKVKMNKPIYLGMSILDIILDITLMYEFWYDYIKPKYQDSTKLCYMDADCFAIYIKSEDFCEDVADDIEKWFDTSNYSKDDNRPLLIGWNEKKRVFFKMNKEEELRKNLLDLEQKHICT